MPSLQGTLTLLLWSLNKWKALMFRRLNDSSMKFIDKHKEFKEAQSLSNKIPSF